MQKTSRPKFPLYFWPNPFVKSRVPGQGEGSVRQFYFWYPWVKTQTNQTFPNFVHQGKNNWLIFLPFLQCRSFGQKNSFVPAENELLNIKIRFRKTNPNLAKIFCLTDYSAGKRINKQTSLFTHAFFRITFTNPEQSFWALNLHLRRAAFPNAVYVL